VKRGGHIFSTMQAQVLVPVFGRAETAETQNKLLDYWRASARYVILDVDIGDLTEGKKNSQSVT